MVIATHHAKAAICLVSCLAGGSLLGLSLLSYHLRELLVCWLFFSLVFVSLALLILTGVLVCCAGGHAIAWACRAARVIWNVVLGAPEIPLKLVPDGRKLK